MANAISKAKPRICVRVSSLKEGQYYSDTEVKRFRKILSIQIAEGKASIALAGGGQRVLEVISTCTILDMRVYLNQLQKGA